MNSKSSCRLKKLIRMSRGIGPSPYFMRITWTDLRKKNRYRHHRSHTSPLHYHFIVRVLDVCVSRSLRSHCTLQHWRFDPSIRDSFAVFTSILFLSVLKDLDKQVRTFSHINSKIPKYKITRYRKKKVSRSHLQIFDFLSSESDSHYISDRLRICYQMEKSLDI